MTAADRREEDVLLRRLREDAQLLAQAFGLPFRRLDKTRRDARLYGTCDVEGQIRIRLRSRTTGAFLRYSSLVATLCHELAHLRHFHHGPSFVRFYRELLEAARARGLYRPASPAALRADRTPRVGPVREDLAASAPRRPRQLPLFW
jgi:predicted metal-dependent hydrolase